MKLTIFGLFVVSSSISQASILVPPSRILDFQCHGTVSPTEALDLYSLPENNFVHFVKTVGITPPLEWDIQVTQVLLPAPQSIQMVGAHLGITGLPDVQYRLTVNNDGTGLVEKRDQSGYNALNVVCQSNLR